MTNHSHQDSSGKMHQLKIKFVKVFLPYLIASVITIVLYGCLRYELDFNRRILKLKEDLLDFWIPILLALIPVIILRRRIRILNLPGKSDRRYFGFQFILVSILAVTTAISQNYLKGQRYDLVKIQGIQSLDSLENEKYFWIDSFGFAFDSCSVYSTSRLFGKNHQTLQFQKFYVIRFNKTDHIWYGISYRESTKNHSGDSFKQQVYREFSDSSNAKFKRYNFFANHYFEKVFHSDDRDGFVNAVHNLDSSINPTEQIILISGKKDSEEDKASYIKWMSIVFGGGMTLVLIVILISKIDPKHYELFKQKKPYKDDAWLDVIRFLDPTRKYPATALLILLNLLVFILMVVMGINLSSPTSDELLAWGGCSRNKVMNGEYWRLLTCIFVHVGMIHVFQNIFALAWCGFLLERYLGTTKMALVFIITGVVGSVLFVLFDDHNVAAGASGAIMGLIGVMLIMNLGKVFPKHERVIVWGTVGFLGGLGLAYDLITIGGNMGHLGGLAAGILLGGILILLHYVKLINIGTEKT